MPASTRASTRRLWLTAASSQTSAVHAVRPAGDVPHELSPSPFSFMNQVHLDAAGASGALAEGGRSRASTTTERGWASYAPFVITGPLSHVVMSSGDASAVS